MLKKKVVWVVLFVFVALSLACVDQTSEANKLVDEANGLQTTQTEMMDKWGKQFTELTDNLKESEDLETFQEENKSKFDELNKLTEQLEKNGNESVAKIEQASKLQIDEKFKEYLSFKAQEFKKRTEVAGMGSLLTKAFAEAKDEDDFTKQVTDTNKKVDEASKEADELAKKAEQVQKDNPDIFPKGS